MTPADLAAIRAQLEAIDNAIGSETEWGSTVVDLVDIARALLVEVERLRAEVAAMSAPVPCEGCAGNLAGLVDRGCACCAADLGRTFATAIGGCDQV